MIVYLDPLRKLSENGWSTYKLIKEKKISNGTIVRIRKGESVSTDTINTICSLLDCQPGEILEYKKGED